jgi:hypothetical protein
MLGLANLDPDNDHRSMNQNIHIEILLRRDDSFLKGWAR